MSNFCSAPVPGVNGAPTPCSKTLPCREHPNQSTVDQSLMKLFDKSAAYILESQALREAGKELLQTIHDERNHQRSIQFCQSDPCIRMIHLFVKKDERSPG